MPPPPRRWIDMDDAKREQAKRDTGKRVRRMRESLGLTVSELADRAGVPRQYIYDLEGGLRVSITNIVAAALGLGLSVDYLLGIKGSSDTAQHNITHDCCLTAARLDAAGRAPGTVLVRAADGPLHPYTGIERGGDVMRRAFGEDVK